MSESETGLSEALLKVLVGVGLIFLAPVVVRDLWNWFVVPVFAAPALTYATAFGLGALKGLLTYRYKKSEADWAPLLSYGWYLLLAWGVGAVAR